MGPELVIAFVLFFVAILFSGVALGGAIGNRVWKVPLGAATWPGFAAVGLTVLLVVVTLQIGGPILELGWLAFCVALHLLLQWYATAGLGAWRRRILVTVSFGLAPWLFVLLVYGALVMLRHALR